MCIADEADSKSFPNASLVASLLGDAEKPVLSIRLRNTGNVPIIVDKELVFLPELVLVDNEHRAISFKEIRAIEKPAVSVLKSRLVTLKPGEEIERHVRLRKEFKRFVTGIGIPKQPSGGETPKVSVYETLCQMPADARPFEIEVSYKPAYSFEEGFAQYMEGVDVAKFFRGPLRVSLAYTFARRTGS